jgi:hypothetical protein
MFEKLSGPADKFVGFYLLVFGIYKDTKLKLVEQQWTYTKAVILIIPSIKILLSF